MSDASPTKWHLAHSTWFFETFVLAPFVANYQSYRSEFKFLFNSYYEAVGPYWPRQKRGVLSRPTVKEVFHYRCCIDEQMARLLQTVDSGQWDAVEHIVGLGIQHEQQHQELLITDLKHAWAINPLRPVYTQAALRSESPPLKNWSQYEDGLQWIGHEGDEFAFDNELPRHRCFLRGFQLADWLVTNGEYLKFIEDGGYQRPELWLSEGWVARQNESWLSPLYWEMNKGAWQVMTLSGCRPLDLNEPVCHISFFEADAFARWCGARLPLETEWEVAASKIPLAGHFQESGRFHPSASPAGDDHGVLYQLDGDVWQWTASPYVAYPGYQPCNGALGEYNGKFMCNQFVLRGSSCATPRSHSRRTYRNFFSPTARWQFTGIRLARECP
jgi:ergothioneine biosynthesis protein EgtB